MGYTIIIADDHPFTAEGMRKVIETEPDVKVIGIANNGIEAISLIKQKKPDCALLDLSMPGANGLEVFLEATRWSPMTRFVIITGLSAAPVFKRLDEAGIQGLFVKNEPPENIRDGVIRILSGERVISERAKAAILKQESKNELSNREYQVLQNLARGQNNREIAADLGVSPKTVDTHRTNLLRKMNVNSTASLLVAAMRRGMIDV